MMTGGAEMTEILYGGARRPGDKTATEIEGMRFLTLRLPSQEESGLLEIIAENNRAIADAWGVTIRDLPSHDLSHLLKDPVS